MCLKVRLSTYTTQVRYICETKSGFTLEEHDTQVLPVEPAIEGLTSTQIDISEPEDEPVLKVAEPI